MTTIVFVSTIAFVAFNFFVTVDGDSRDEDKRCDYSPRGVRVAWKPSREGDYHVKFFVPPHRWGEYEEDVPITLGLEWGEIEQPNTLQKTRYSLEPSRGAAAGHRSPSQATRLPHKSLLLGWNELPLTWHNTSGGALTLFIGHYKTEVKIRPQDEVNVTVEGMDSVLNCDYIGGAIREYTFNSSSFWRNKIVPFYWERNGHQDIDIYRPFLLSFSTHSRGRNLTFCIMTNETRYSEYWHLRRTCPPPLWREHGEGDPSGIYIKGFDIDLEEEEDYLVVKGNWSFLQLDVKYTTREGQEVDLGAWIQTWNQRSVDVIYEDVFPSQDVENATTALPNTTGQPNTTDVPNTTSLPNTSDVPTTTPSEECPVCSVFCTPFNIYLVIVDVISWLRGSGWESALDSSISTIRNK